MNIFTTVVGSHMWGMEHERSDVDIYTCYVDDIHNLLSGRKLPDTKFKQYMNFDVTSIELSNLIGGLIKSNPNYVYAVMTPIVISTSGFHAQLKDIVIDTISLDMYNPIRGLAIHNYKKYIENGLDISQKRLKTIARTIKFGCNLFDNGEICFEPYTKDVTVDDILKMLDELEIAYTKNYGQLPEHTDEEPYRYWLEKVRDLMICKRSLTQCYDP